MSGLRAIVSLFALGVVQVFLPQVWSGFGAIDWLLIYIVVQALRSSFRTSVLLGAGGGLIQDSLAGGILGLHAFAKTSVAALIAAFGGLLVVRGPLPEAIVVGAAAALEGLIVVSWQLMLGRAVSIDMLDVAVRALATAVAAFVALSSLRRWEERALRKARGGRR
jgi:rod shape-determining protein MreD